MNLTTTLETECSEAVLVAVLSDLATYPSWMGIVAAVEPAEPDLDDPGPAWVVELRGQLGPLRRSKRLRMCRTTGGEQFPITFERVERDDRTHSLWQLTVEGSAVGHDTGHASGSEQPRRTAIAVTLQYGGSLWIPLLSQVLDAEIDRSRIALVEYLKAVEAGSANA
ncbi:MAG TPA: hypothetical protein DEG43_17595 [Acidimicrobiaceae bacterium]|jgi:hypothetical protein|nr:hypothetical protein [Acidimicrobiaceae bacterium]